MVFLEFSIALIVALGLTPLARSVATRFGVVDYPAHRKIHQRPTPLLGGLAFFAAVAVATIASPRLFVFESRLVWGVLLGGALFLVLGLVDDLRDLGAWKLLLEFGIAWLVVEVTSASFYLPWQPVAVALTVLWIVGIANAFNCLDCADGVAAVSGLGAAAAFLTMGLLGHLRMEVVWAAAILGACAGFLRYNLHPARIFLGDAGSLVLGYFVAMVGVLLSPSLYTVPAIAAPIVVLAIPIADFLLVHWKRFHNGERSLRRLLTSAGKDHLPHRLMARGVTPHGLTVTMLVASVVLGMAALAIAAVNTAAAAIFIVVLVAAALFLAEREWVAGREQVTQPLIPSSGAQPLEGP